MKKKLLMAAVGAALVAGPMLAANAATTVYGRVHVSVDMFDTGGDDTAAHGDSPDGLGIVSNSSRVGVKGSEDLGGGLKGIYQVEFGYNADEDGGANSQRNTFAGLGGGFGEVRVGRHDTPYKMATGALDPFSETVGDYNAIIGNIGGSTPALDARISNVIAYLSPNMSGLSFAAAYGVGPVTYTAAQTGVAAVAPAQANGADNQDVTALSLMGMYSQGPLFASLAYEKQAADTLTGTVAPVVGVTGDLEVEGTKIGFGYDLGMMKLGLVYEMIDVSFSGFDAIDSNNLWLTANGTVANNTWAVSYGKADETDDGADDGADLIALGLFHNFSKTTRAYVSYVTVSNDTNGTYRYGDSGHGDLLTAVAGKDNDALSLGMIVDF